MPHHDGEASAAERAMELLSEEGLGGMAKRWSKAFFAEQGLFLLEVAHAQFGHARRRAH